MCGWGEALSKRGTVLRFLIYKRVGISLALRIESRLGIKELIACRSVVRSGKEMFCSCSGFRFGVRVIYSTALFIKHRFNQ